MAELCPYVNHHCWCSTEPTQRLAGVLAIDQLIDVKAHLQSLYACSVKLACIPEHLENAGSQLLGENAAKIGNFGDYLRLVFQPTTDARTLEVAAEALGHLVRSGGALTAQVVDSEVSALCMQLALHLRWLSNVGRVGASGHRVAGPW